MATKTEQDIEKLTAILEELELKKEAEDAIKASVTQNMRELAVAIHTLLCPDEHGPNVDQCNWFLIENANNADLVDWTEATHAAWLVRAQLGVGKMIELGFEVVDPDEVDE